MNHFSREELFSYFIFLLFFLLTRYSGSAQSSSEQVDSLSSVVFDQYYYNSFDTALMLFEEASIIATESKDTLKLLETHINIAWLSLYHDQLETMDSILILSESLLKKKIPEDKLLLGDFYYSKALFLFRIGNYINAIRQFRQIISSCNGKAETAEDSSLFYDSYSSIGISYLEAGNIYRSIENYKTAQVYLSEGNEAINFELEKSINLQYLGSAYLSLFQYNQNPALLETAKTYFLEASTWLERVKADPRLKNNLSTNYLNLSKVYLELNMSDSSQYYIDKAHQLHGESESIVAKILEQESKIKSENGDHQGAIDLLKKAYQKAIYETSGNTLESATFLTQMAEEYLIMNKPIEAIKLTERSKVILFKDTLSQPLQELPLQQIIQTLYAECKVQQMLYLSKGEIDRLTDALMNFEKLINLIDQSRYSFPNKKFKQYLSAQSREIHESAIEVCWQLYNNSKNNAYLEKAFWFAEKNKSYSLLEASYAKDAIQFTQIPVSLKTKEDNLRNRINYLSRLSRKSDLPEDYRKLEQVKSEYENMLNQLETDYESYYDVKYGISIPSLTQIQKTQQDEDQILSFFYGQRSLYLFNISVDATILLKLERPDEILDQLIEKLQSSPGKLETSHTNEIKKLSQQLFQELFQDIRLKRNLLIIPDEKLFYLPFEALVKEDGNYLLQLSSILYDQSVSLNFKSIHQKKPLNHNYLGFAPVYEGAIISQKSIDSLNLGNLIFNKQEVAALHEKFGGTKFESQYATKSSYLESIRKNNYNIIHLSAHARVDFEEHLNSGVIFSKIDGESRILTAHEIYDHNLNTELTILSACESGFGKQSTGEGLLSLARAFHYAGSKSVMYSLWNANDQSTFHLTNYFGEFLEEGLTKSEALRLAKLKLLENYTGAYTHPYYWSHLVISGSDTPIVVKRSTSIYFVILVPILFVILYFLRRYWLR